MDEDEKKIAAGYRPWIAPFFVASPIVAAFAGDVKWVVAVSAVAIIVLLLEAGGRLLDLCIRLRRVSLLLGKPE